MLVLLHSIVAALKCYPAKYTAREPSFIKLCLVLILLLLYSLKFSRIKYFVVFPDSAQKQIFADKIFVV